MGSFIFRRDKGVKFGLPLAVKLINFINLINFGCQADI